MDSFALSDFTPPSSRPSTPGTDGDSTSPDPKIGGKPIKQVPRESSPHLAKTGQDRGHFNDDASDTTSEAASLGWKHTITPVSLGNDDEEGSCYSDYSDDESIGSNTLNEEAPEVTQQRKLFLDLAHIIADDVQDGIRSEEVDSVRSGTPEQQQLAQAYDKCRGHVVTALKGQHETDAVFWADLTKTVRDVVVESKKEASAVNGRSRIAQFVDRTIESYECAMEEKGHGREVQGQRFTQVAAYTKRAVELLKQELGHPGDSHEAIAGEESLATSMVESLDQLARDEKEMETAPGIRSAELKRNIQQTKEALKLYDRASRGDEAASSSLFEGHYAKEVDYFTGCMERLSMSLHDTSGATAADNTAGHIAEEMKQALVQLADYKEQLEALPRSNQAIDKGASDPVNAAHLLRLAIKQTFEALDCYDQASEEEDPEQYKALLHQAATTQDAADCFQEAAEAVQKAFGEITYVQRKLADKDLEEPHYSDEERGQFLQQAQDHYEEGMNILGELSQDEEEEPSMIDGEERSLEGDLAPRVSTPSYASDEEDDLATQVSTSSLSSDEEDEVEGVREEAFSQVKAVPVEHEGIEKTADIPADLLSEAEFHDLAERQNHMVTKALLHVFSLLSQGEQSNISRFQDLGKMAQKTAQHFQEAAEMMEQAEAFTSSGNHERAEECYQQARISYNDGLDLSMMYVDVYALEMEAVEHEVVPEVSSTPSEEQTHALVKARLPEGGFQNTTEAFEYHPATYEEALAAIKPFNISEDKWLQHINEALEKGATPDFITALQKYRAHAIELYNQGDYDMACFMAQSVKNIEQSVEYSIHAQEPGLNPDQVFCWNDAAHARFEMDYYEMQYAQIPASLDLFADRIQRALGNVIEQTQEALKLHLEAEHLFAEGNKQDAKKTQKAAMGLHEKAREMADRITTGTNYLYSLLEPKN